MPWDLVLKKKLLNEGTCRIHEQCMGPTGKKASIGKNMLPKRRHNMKSHVFIYLLLFCLLGMFELMRMERATTSSLLGSQLYLLIKFLHPLSSFSYLKMIFLSFRFICSNLINHSLKLKKKSQSSSESCCHWNT